jgi:hypothetical protein
MRFRDKRKVRVRVRVRVPTYPSIESFQNPVLGSCLCLLLPTNLCLPLSVFKNGD